MQRGNVKLMKKINISLIIKMISKLGPLSRADLTSETGLSPTTVSALIDELLKKKLISEVGVGESKGGRKPILLDINPEYSYILSAQVSSHMITIALLNMKYEIISMDEISIKTPIKENIDGQIIDSVDKIITRNNVGENDIIGFALGWTGIIDKDAGVIKYSAKMDLREYHLLDKIKSKYSFPVYLENDTNLAALSEKEFGHTNLSNYIYIMIGSQIGAGIILEDEIYQGYYGKAGEFGHMIVKKDGPLCNCGSRGCLTAVITQLISIEGKQEFRNSFKTVDMKSRRYQEFVEYLSLAVTNYIHLFDTQAIIFGGELVKVVPDSFYEEIKRKVKEYSMTDLYNDFSIYKSSLADKAVIMGGASLCFQRSEFLNNK